MTTAQGHTQTTQTPKSWSQFQLVSRLLLALVGGYGVAATAAYALGSALPLKPVDAALTAMMASFAVFTAAAVWAFAAANLARAASGLGIAAALLMLLAWAIR